MDIKIVSALNRLPGWLSIHEGQFLHKAALILKNKKGAVVEIGSFQGKSTIYLAKTNQRIYAIDPHRGKLDNGTKITPTLTAFKKNITDFYVKSNVVLIQKTSFSAAKSWKKKIKLLFIDGLHDEKNAESDYDKWSPFLIDGGIVAMHDSFCGWKGAQKVALQKIISNNDYYEIGVVGSIVYGIKGTGNIFTRLNQFRIRIFIQTAYWIKKQKYIPSQLSFILIHRFIKLLLLNHFTLKRK